MIVALHGFLGLPSDWESTARHWGPELWSADSWTPNLWQDVRHICASSEAPRDGFAAWVVHFIGNLEKRTSGKTILLGYSLGGRLAMHALLARPDLFQAAVIVSAHPGLEDEEERARRCESDLRWMRRFAQDPWSPLLQDWNSQGALARSPERPRPEVDFDRKALATGMGLWSLGRQENLREALHELPLPILYLTGAQDTKFSTLFTDYSQRLKNPRHRHEILPKAGHRLPWDDQDGFRDRVREFFTTWSLG